MSTPGTAIAFSMKKISTSLQGLSRDVADFHLTIQQQQLELEHKDWLLGEVAQAIAVMNEKSQPQTPSQVPPIFRSLEQLDLSQASYEAFKENYPLVTGIFQLVSMQNAEKLDYAVIEEVHQKLALMGLKFGRVPDHIWEG